MRQGSGGRRQRGRSGGGGGRKQVPLKMQNFDSNGPDVRVRGNATQVYEKYLALARDASAAGDRVIAESYFQHAEHYYRIVNENTDPPAEARNGQAPQQDGAHAGARDGQDESNAREAAEDGRVTRQQRRARHEAAERAATSGTANGQEGAEDDGDESLSADGYQRPDGYGRLDAAEAGNGEAQDAAAANGDDGQPAAEPDSPARATRSRRARAAEGSETAEAGTAPPKKTPARRRKTTKPAKAADETAGDGADSDPAGSEPGAD